MKQLSKFIQEKLQINKDDKVKQYHHQPQDKIGLVKICQDKIYKEKTWDFNDIDTSKITDMENLFDLILDRSKIGLIENLKPKVSNWDVSNVTDMSGMFDGLSSFNDDLSFWDVSQVTDFSGMFWNCTSFEGKGLDKWDTSSAKDIHSMFKNCESFNQNLSNWDVSNVDDFGSMFRQCFKMDFDFSNWNVDKMEIASYMFYKCTNFKGKGLDKWNVNKLETSKRMFSGCENLEANLDNWTIPFSCDTTSMFNNCKKIPSWYK